MSSSYNVSLHCSDIPDFIDCFFTSPSSIIITLFCITNVLLLLPLFIFIIYLGVQRWRQQRSTSAAETTSHSDSFTYHMVAVELIGIFGTTLCSCGIHRYNVTLVYVGYGFWSFTWCGEMFFHVLTCVERYLAVVHPVTYLGMKGEGGTRIRNISIGFVWLFCFGTTCLLSLNYLYVIVALTFLIFSTFIVSFCSLSVLRVLIRPGPGEQGGDRGRVDQSKRRAFHTMLVILGVLMLRTFLSLVWAVLHVLRERNDCEMSVQEIWLKIPSSLVLPLLFLQRAGILTCCKNNTE